MAMNLGASSPIGLHSTDCPGFHTINHHLTITGSPTMVAKALLKFGVQNAIVCCYHVYFLFSVHKKPV